MSRRHTAVKPVAIDTLHPLGRQTRRHTPRQVAKLASSILEDGFVLPILIDDRSRVVAGWGLVQAALKLEMPEVPAIVVTGMPEHKLRSLRLRLNRLAEEAPGISRS